MDDIAVGDEVYNLDGTASTILGFKVEKLDEPVLVYNLEVEDLHSYFVGSTRILVHNYSVDKPKAWIQHDTYNEVVNKYGKSVVEKFVNSMKKGIVGKEGENGIKYLKDGINRGNTTYHYEIKVKGKFGDFRIFGNYDETSGHIIFDKFDRGEH